MRCKANNSVVDWPTQVQEHRQHCEAASETMAELIRQADKGGGTARLVRRLGEEIEQISQEAHQLHQILLKDPIDKALSLDRLNLSEQQYRLLQAGGLDLSNAKQLGVSPISDYEAYRFCTYEDETGINFMDPNETPHTVTRIKGRPGAKLIRIRLAQSPEECRVACLRPEQRAFFAEYRPDVLKRMQPERTLNVQDGGRRHDGATRNDPPATGESID